MKKVRVGAALLALVMLVCAAASADELRQVETKKYGKLARREWQDGSGTPVNGPEGYAYILFSYKDGAVTERYFTADDQPYKTFGGYYARTMSYGNGGRLAEVIYLDAQGKWMMCGAGYARVKITFTMKGQETGVNYYDTDNRLVRVPSLGYAAIKCEYRGTTLTKRTYLDEDRNPTDTPEGYAVMVQSVNKEHRNLEIRYEHADGRPATCADGWSVCSRSLDKKGRAVELRYLDESGNAVNTRNGYAAEAVSWVNNQTCIISRFDTAGNRVPMGDGYISLQQETDRQGRLIRESYLDADGRNIANAAGHTAVRYTYNEDGTLLEMIPEN